MRDRNILIRSKNFLMNLLNSLWDILTISIDPSLRLFMLRMLISCWCTSIFLTSWSRIWCSWIWCLSFNLSTLSSLESFRLHWLLKSTSKFRIIEFFKIIMTRWKCRRINSFLTRWRPFAAVSLYCLKVRLVLRFFCHFMLIVSLFNLLRGLWTRL